MKSVPIIAGRLYRVTGHGLNLTIIARHPCDAINIAVEQLPCAS